MLTEFIREVFRDKLRVAVMSGIYSIFCFAMWLYLDDEGFQVAAILFAGFSVHQFYKHHLQKSTNNRAVDEQKK